MAMTDPDAMHMTSASQITTLSPCCRCTLQGSRVFGFDTPASLKLVQGSVITVASTVHPQPADA